MAGEIEDHFRLDIKADSLHSGSISFGRFEDEALCWERRSSFSRNRYLEEVEKCSKPGSVTEKKAYFEAHFRKKGIPSLGSPENQNETEYQNSENNRSEKTAYAEEIGHLDAETHSSQFDESLNSSVYGSEHELMEQEKERSGSSNLDATELSHDSNDNVDCVSDPSKIKEVNQAKLGSVLSTDCRSEIEVKGNFDGDAHKSYTSNMSNMSVGQFNDSHATKENSDASHKGQRGSSSKEKVSSQAERVKPRLVHRVSAAHSLRYISCKEASEGSGKKPSKTMNIVMLRSQAEKKTAEAISQDKCPMHKTTRCEPGSKDKEVNLIKRGEKESRNRQTGVPQSSMLQKVSGRVHQSGNRIKHAVGVGQLCMEKDSSRCSFKCNEHAERRKQFDLKLEEKMHAKISGVQQIQVKTQEKTETEIKTHQKSLTFKATPLPSFYRGVLRGSDRNKAVASNIQTRKQRTKSSSTGSTVSESSRLNFTAGKHQAIVISPPKTADPPQASGATSCHSTVTSDSSPSSPAAEISEGLHSHATVNSRVDRIKEREKGKFTSLHKHKVPEHHKFYKGKIMDGKLRKRTERANPNCTQE